MYLFKFLKLVRKNGIFNIRVSFSSSLVGGVRLVGNPIWTCVLNRNFDQGTSFTKLRLHAGSPLLDSWVFSLSCSRSNVACWAQVNQKFVDAGKSMWTTLKCPDVWRPCVYMYFSLALSLNILDGMFFWYTDSKDGPHFSQVFDNY